MNEHVSPADYRPVAPWSLASRASAGTRDRILSAASALFCNHGFAATGVDAVVARAGTAKATLYKHFPSKSDLVRAVLEAEGEAWRTWFFGELAATRAGARERLLAIFDVLETWFADPAFYGCAFINAVAEFDTEDDAIRALTAAHKKNIVTWIEANAIELGVPDANATAMAFVVLIDGAIVAAQHKRDPGFAQVAKAMAECHLDCATVSARERAGAR